MSCTHVISAQANMRATHVKPRSGGRSQNYMPPEAADALKKAETANASAVVVTPASAPAAPAAK